MANLLYGTNLLKNDTVEMLEQNERLKRGVRTWQHVLGGVSQSYQAGSGAATASFSDAVSQAYKSHLTQKNTIMNMGLSAGGTREQLSASKRALTDAYNTYLGQYSSAQNTLAENYLSDVTDVRTELEQRAKNFDDYYKAHYDYVADELSKIDGNPFFQQYTFALSGDDGDYSLTQTEKPIDHYLSWMGDGQGGIRSWEEIKSMITDESGYLTDKGRDFLSYIENSQERAGYSITDENGDTRIPRSFDQWLSDTNPELRTWAQSADEYNYNLRGTSAGSANVYSGRDSREITHNPDLYKDNSAAIRRSVNSAYANVRRGLNRDALFGGGFRNFKNTDSTVNKAFDALETDIKSIIGDAAYKDFVTANKSLFDEYDALFDTEYSYTTAAYNAFAAWYNKYLQALVDYEPQRIEKVREKSNPGI